MSCWGIRHIRQQRRQTICGETPLEYSQPFYTSTNGYKTRENVSEWTWHRSRNTPVTSLCSRTSSDIITQVLEAMVAGLGTTEAVLTTASKKYVDTPWFLLYWSDESVSIYWTIVLESASLNTLDYYVGEMRLSIQKAIVLVGCIPQYSIILYCRDASN